MENNRRNDVGKKIGFYILYAVIALFLYATGYTVLDRLTEVDARGHSNELRISVEEERTVSIKEDIGEIKVIQRSMDDKIDVLIAR